MNPFKAPLALRLMLVCAVLAGSTLAPLPAAGAAAQPARDAASSAAQSPQATVVEAADAAPALMDRVTSAVVITLTASGFSPANITVGAGTLVTWHNSTQQAQVLHSGLPYLIYLPRVAGSTTASAAPQTAVPAAVVDTFGGVLPPGGNFSHTFSQAGTTTYYLVGLPQTRGAVLTLPADPATTAPPLNLSVSTDIFAATQFIYSGSNPLQIGVAPGTINPQRVTVLRGRVLDRSQHPLPGAVMTILHHPEFGQTWSREDGHFDMAANGGSVLTLVYNAPGYLPAQRQVTAPWRDYAELPDVVLIPADPNVTLITMGSSLPMQVARGSLVSDTDGSRQQTLLFPAGTTAYMTLPSGLTQTLTALHVRSTEFTVGAMGPNAMPAQLPPNSAYTYALEFSADEATSAGASGPTFNQPIIAYNQNFLSFPVGITIPVGYYDPAHSAWMPSANGLVLKILSISGGRANLDVDGSGNPAGAPALAALGISDAERAELASLYSAGQSLWRVSVTHFSHWDDNMGLTCQNSDCVPPDEPPPQTPPCPCPDNQAGSIIASQNQALGETLNVVGTDYSLSYRSDLVPGHVADDSLNIPLIGSTLPRGMIGIDLTVYVAGRSFYSAFPPTPNQVATFSWDGKDAYGRQMQGSQPVTVQIGYIYHLQYASCSRFGEVCGGFIPVGIDLTRQTFTLYQIWNGAIGAWNAVPEGLGGWGLDVHHTYDPFGMVLYLGDGTRRNVSALDIDSISTVAGTPSSTLGDGGPATQAQLHSPYSVVVAPDGSYYIADTANGRIRRVGTDGIITTVAGDGSIGFSGDGGPATAAKLSFPQGLALGPDGSLYFADYGNKRVRRIDPAGIITTVAGSGTAGFSGDGGPATQAKLNWPTGVSVAKDGSFYIADLINGRIRRVATDGIITTLAGAGGAGFNHDGIPATQAYLCDPFDVALGPDGSVYVSDYCNSRIRRIDVTGIITTVVGTGAGGSSGDGGPATKATISGPWGINFGPDGSLYIADHYNNRIRRVGPDGIISTVAGGGGAPTGFGGDGGPATSGTIYSSLGVAVAPNGNLYISDTGNSRIRLVKPVLAQFSTGDIDIPSQDGNQIYVFNASGRHLSTLDALTGAAIYQFTYDGAGRLATVIDRAGNVTTIQHNGNGQPTGIVSPYGQTTPLTVDAHGYLASITDPANETVHLTSTAQGLLTLFTDARGNSHHFAYDSVGRLISDQDPAGGASTLGRVDGAGTYSVTVTTALSRTTRYEMDVLPSGGQRALNVLPNGLTTQWTSSASGSLAGLLEDGTNFTQLSQPDPRWGMAGAFPKVTAITTTHGLTAVIALASSAALADTSNPFSLQGLTDTVQVNRQVYTDSWSAAPRTDTQTTPLGRQTIDTLDALGRVIEEQAAGFWPTTYAYDSHGRLLTQTIGSGPSARITRFGYDSHGFLDSITDPLGHVTSLTNDAAGRVLSQTLPGGAVIAYHYDANGNLTSLAPPGRPAHAYSYTPLDLLASSTPASVGPSLNPTTYTYNIDRQLTRIDWPDGRAATLGYDSAGRPIAQTIARGTTSYSYDPATGQLATADAPGGVDLAFQDDGLVQTGATWSGPVTGVVSDTYNNNFGLAAQSIDGGFTTTYQYDGDNLLRQAGALALSRNSQNALLTGTTLGQVAEVLSYNGFGEPIRDSSSYSGTLLLDQQYQRDPLGRIVVLTDTVGGVTHVTRYSYDVVGRLIGATNGITTTTYTYDGNGNRLMLSGPGGVVTGTYDAQDRLTAYGATHYGYTASGQLLTKTVASQTTTYQYDELGNLITATLPSATQISYRIDAQNRRVGKLVNGTPQQGFLYQGLNPVAELDGSNAVVSVFVYGSRANVPDYMVKGGVTYRILSDELGSPRLVVNSATGQIVQRMDYDEFGRVLTDTNPGFQPFGFAGGLYDRDTGLVRFGARDYDPQTGRWTTKDLVVLTLAGTNDYSYALGDPINMTDPNGLGEESSAGTGCDLCDASKWLFDESPMAKAEHLGLIAFANVFAQVGATVGEVCLAPVRLFGSNQLGDLQHKTLWGMTQRGFNDAYRHVLDMPSVEEAEKAEFIKNLNNTAPAPYDQFSRSNSLNPGYPGSY